MARKTRNKAQVEEGAVATEIAPAPIAEAPASPIRTIIGTSKPVRSRKNRQTGTIINLYAPVAPGVTWVTQCAAHGTEAHYGSRKGAKSHDGVYEPAKWCEGCATVLADKAKPAAETPATEEVIEA
jgi:hypothetical protein